jgi:hypothetical protein
VHVPPLQREGARSLPRIAVLERGPLRRRGFRVLAAAKTSEMLRAYLAERAEMTSRNLVTTSTLTAMLMVDLGRAGFCSGR